MMNERNELQQNIESLTFGNLEWIHITNPTKQEIAYLARNYSFNQLDLDDCLSKIQRPKVDTYNDYLFWVFHFPVYNKERRIASHTQISVFISDKYIVTLHNADVRPITELFKECQKDKELLNKIFSHGPAYVLYKILDRNVDAYFPVLDKILLLIDNVEDAAFDENAEVAQEVAILRRDIITQRRIILPMRTLMSEMPYRLKRYAAVDMGNDFGDLLDHVNKICETLDECKEVIEVFTDVDYILTTERINRVIRILTIFSAVTLPFVALASIFGMNVVFPGGVDKGNVIPFVLILSFMFLISGGMLYFFHLKHWI